MKKLADSLKFFARKLGLPDAEVARKSGLSEVRYGHYVRGRSEPDLATLLRICRVLNVTPNDLLLRSENENGGAVKNSVSDESEILRNRTIAGIKQLRTCS